MPVYIKTGRGGAGNMISAEELQRKEQADLEAQQSQDLANEVIQEQVEAQGSGDTAEYKHMGRGGAGNWYTPAELKNSGAFTDTTTKTDPTSLNPKHASHHVDPRPWRGRGGAGNFAYDKPVEPETLELEEREAAKEIEAEVRKDVETGLKRPDSAYLAADKKTDF